MKLKVGKYVNSNGKIISILEIDKYKFIIWYTFPTTKSEYAARYKDMGLYLKKYGFEYVGLEWD